MIKFTPLSEWTAPSMRLEEFVLGATRQALPFDIRVGVAHIWLREQNLDQVAARLLCTTTKVAEAAGQPSGQPSVGASLQPPLAANVIPSD
jgi:hypothetical protein